MDGLLTLTFFVLCGYSVVTTRHPTVWTVRASATVMGLSAANSVRFSITGHPWFASICVVNMWLWARSWHADKASFEQQRKGGT